MYLIQSHFLAIARYHILVLADTFSESDSSFTDKESKHGCDRIYAQWDYDPLNLQQVTNAEQSLIKSQESFYIWWAGSVVLIVPWSNMWRQHDGIPRQKAWKLPSMVTQFSQDIVTLSPNDMWVIDLDEHHADNLGYPLGKIAKYGTILPWTIFQPHNSYITNLILFKLGHKTSWHHPKRCSKFSPITAAIIRGWQSNIVSSR